MKSSTHKTAVEKSTKTIKTFADLGVLANIVLALTELGYETPTPIQTESIPVLLEGKDLFAQAQTGTGKTAAFALPILNKIDLGQKHSQALVLAPTRELAIQVAEAFQSYAKHLKNFHVLPIYGGQDFRNQLKALKRGAHVIVGTPGRVMDHIRRETLTLDNIKHVVLDEADEMLNMGFIDDVKWILEQIPGERQTALFSATMPSSIVDVAKRYLKNAKKIHIQPKEATVANIKQFYTLVSNNHKLEALTRFLEVEDFDAALIFARTKIATAELADKLEARGYTVAALHGDMSQALREKVIENLKKKNLDIVVATDVAARGLDVERISLVLNYDVPYDTESYVHRIGRTGRAGRIGKALLFIAPRERRMLRDIERAINQSIPSVEPPSASQITAKREKAFADQILTTLASIKLDRYREIVEKLVHDNECSELDIAAVLAYLVQKEKPLIIEEKPWENAATEKTSPKIREKRRKFSGKTDDKKQLKDLESGMTRCKLEMGYNDDLRPGNVVGLIANKCNVSSKYIGPIQIFDDYTLVDVDDSILEKVISLTKNIRLKNKKISIRVSR